MSRFSYCNSGYKSTDDCFLSLTARTCWSCPLILSFTLLKISIVYRRLYQIAVVFDMTVSILVVRVWWQKYKFLNSHEFTNSLDIVSVNVEISVFRERAVRSIALVFHEITDASDHHSRWFRASLFSSFLHSYSVRTKEYTCIMNSLVRTWRETVCGRQTPLSNTTSTIWCV